MFSPFVPRIGTFEALLAFGFRARCSLRRLASRHQARLLHFLDVCFPFELDATVALGDGSFYLKRSMHAAKVLREQILAVEFTPLAVDGAIRARRAPVILQAQMLRGNVSLPLVFGAKRACAASERKGTWERPRMRGSDMLAQRRKVLERGMAAMAAMRLLLHYRAPRPSGF